jgi:hypothetical protein
MPQLILAMVQQQLGNPAEARTTLNAALQLYDWSPDHATDADAWMFHVLRREAEKMVEPSTRSSKP